MTHKDLIVLLAALLAAVLGAVALLVPPAQGRLTAIAVIAVAAAVAVQAS